MRLIFSEDDIRLLVETRPKALEIKIDLDTFDLTNTADRAEISREIPLTAGTVKYPEANREPAPARPEGVCRP